VIIGANAAGKSNFADAIDFLSLIFRAGLHSAMRAKGGFNSIAFRRKRRTKASVNFHFTVEVQPHWPVGSEEVNVFDYRFELKATVDAIKSDFQVKKEFLSKSTRNNSSCVLQWSLERNGKGIEISPSPKSAKNRDINFLTRFTKDFSMPDDDLIVPSVIQNFPVAIELGRFMKSVRVFQISPTSARGTGVPERFPEMGKRGENLPSAVDYLKRNQSAEFDELVSLLSMDVPTITGLKTQYVETKQLGLFFEEQGFGRPWYANEVSDGTIQTLCLFLPLLDERTNFILIEEPENSIHPWALRHFVSYCQKKSNQKQIVLTTHSISLLDQIEPGALILAQREDGKTTMTKCMELYPETLRIVNEELFKLGEYWDSGQLGAVPSQIDLFEA